MIHYQKNINIDATPEAVWAILRRFMHIHEFAPFVKSVNPLTEGEIGLGSKRRCNFNDGTSVVEEIVEWQDGQRYRVELSEMTSMPLHEMFAEICLVPQGDTVKVIWSMDYRVKFGPLGWLLGNTIMKLMMGKILKANLNGLAEKVKV